eukprot:1885789-Rhodomonas_salina.2
MRSVSTGPNTLSVPDHTLRRHQPIHFVGTRLHATSEPDHALRQYRAPHSAGRPVAQLVAGLTHRWYRAAARLVAGLQYNARVSTTDTCRIIAYCA